MTQVKQKKQIIAIALLLIVAMFGLAFAGIGEVSAASNATKVRNGAAAWAKKIANDNSFKFGKGKKAYRAGCYFCGTNKKKKGKGWEKTYCSNPFVQAAFAHGGKDSTCLKDCKAGKPGPFSKNDFVKHKKFKVIKKPAQTKLVKGDVIGNSGTVAIYIGGGKIAAAEKEGNTKDSIAVKTLTKDRYKKATFVARYY